MLGAKTGRAARKYLAVFRNILFETLHVFIIHVVYMTLAVFANAFFRRAARAADLVVAVARFFVSILVHNGNSLFCFQNGRSSLSTGCISEIVLCGSSGIYPPPLGSLPGMFCLGVRNSTSSATTSNDVRLIPSLSSY